MMIDLLSVGEAANELTAELRAIDVASRGSRRPRYRIDPADLAIFENGRAVATKPAPKRRPRRSPEVIQFF